MNKTTYLLIALLLSSAISYAQTKRIRDHDTTYYVSYREKLTVRTYLSRKYTAFKLKPPENNPAPEMKYLPNTTLNIGIGASYRSLTLNIGVGVSTFNPNNERGHTKYLDLQTHWYTRTWNFDILGQFYRGYYLTPQGLGSEDGKSYYVRGDLKLGMGGIAAYSALNGRKFSYQAGLVQNEWQKKSAGSILVGGEAYYGSVHGDSSVVPATIDSSYSRMNIAKIHFFEIGPGIGYAYTYVFKEHYFILGSLTVNVDLSYTREKATDHYADKFIISPNYIFRAGAGYNTAKWNLSILWVATYIHFAGEVSDYKYRISTGNYRLFYARRFTINKKVKNVLEPINNLVEPSN